MEKPKICVPLTGRTRREINDQLDIINEKSPDIIELRADFLENIDNNEEVLSIVENIIDKIEVPLLFTIRSEREGGEAIALTEDEKVILLKEVCAKTNVTYVDYEVENDKSFVSAVQESAKQYNKQLILSYHNFEQTPANEELMKRFLLMEIYGANIAKVAVMPESRQDVFRLLQLTSEVNDMISIPLATMSMGELGAYSRLMGWVYGSTLTFAVGVASSAPGQIPIDDLRRIINDTESIIG